MNQHLLVNEALDIKLRKASAMTTLTSLNYHNGKLLSSELKTIQAFPNLRHLRLEGIRLTASSIKQLQTLTRLESLELCNNHIGGQGIVGLFSLPLQSLSFSVGDLIQWDWSALPTTLKKLSVEPTDPPSCYNFKHRIPHTGLSYLTALTDLSLFKIDFSLQYLHCSNLHHLKVGVSVISEADYKFLLTCTKLQSLNLTLDIGFFSEPGLLCKHIPGIRMLKVNSLEEDPRDPVLGVRLCIEPEVEELVFKRQKIAVLAFGLNSSGITGNLKTLRLKRNHLTDQGVSALKDNESLTRLDLRHNYLTDNCLAYLAPHPGITHLSLSENPIQNYGALSSNDIVLSSKDGSSAFCSLLANANTQAQKGRRSLWMLLIAVLLRV